jgi:hypothetical protein
MKLFIEQTKVKNILMEIALFTAALFLVSGFLHFSVRAEIAAKYLENGSYRISVQTEYPEESTEAFPMPERAILKAQNGEAEAEITFAGINAPVSVPVAALDSKEFYTLPLGENGALVHVTLTFASDSLPAGAIREEASPAYQEAEPEKLSLTDGEYLIPVTLTGGSGRARFESPVSCKVKDGYGTLTLIWDSPHYDYMIVAGSKYLPLDASETPEDTRERSVFQIPLISLTQPMTVIGDTTAMSVPHEVQYTLTFSGEEIRSAGHGPWLWGLKTGMTIFVLLSAVFCGIIVGIWKQRRRKKKL